MTMKINEKSTLEEIRADDNMEYKYRIVENCLNKFNKHTVEAGYAVVGQTDDPIEAIRLFRESTNEKKDVLGPDDTSVTHILVQYM